MSIETIESTIDSAQLHAGLLDSFGDGLTLDDAYAIQEGILRRRLGAGQRLAGLKLGFTSRAKMAQMGVDHVIVGWLLEAMRASHGVVAGGARLRQGRAEAEVAFRIARRVDLGARPEEIVDAVDAVAPAIEILDSRYRDFRFSLPDVVADNASAAAFAVGGWVDVTAVDVAARPVELSFDGVVVGAGSTRDILGDPMAALDELASAAKAHGIGLVLEPGMVVLAGAATVAVPLGDARVIQANVDGLGVVSVSMS